MCFSSLYNGKSRKLSAAVSDICIVRELLGDDAEPRAHPATAIIFVGSLLTIVFGVLNLIVAVAACLNVLAFSIIDEWMRMNR